VGKIRQKNEKIILSAAEYVFAINGFDGATMNKISLQAKLPKANIHYYFSNKLQLYKAVFFNILELWDSELNEMSALDSPFHAIKKYVEAKLNFSRKYPYASRVFANEVLSDAPRLRDYFMGSYAQWFAKRVDVFKQWQKQGKIDDIAPEHILFLIWSSTQQYADYGFQLSAAMGKESLNDDDFKTASEVLTHVILKGIGAKAD